MIENILTGFMCVCAFCLIFGFILFMKIAIEWESKVKEFDDFLETFPDLMEDLRTELKMMVELKLYSKL